MRSSSQPVGRSPLAHVNLGLLAHQVGKAAPDTADGGHGVHDLLLAVHVGVEHTQNVLELLSRDERLRRQTQKQMSGAVKQAAKRLCMAAEDAQPRPTVRARPAADVNRKPAVVGRTA